MNQKIILLSILLWLALPLTAQQSAEGILKQAESYYEQNQTRQALNLFSKYIEMDSTNAYVFYLRGNCFAEVNQTERAKSDYLTALSLDPDLSNVYYNLGNTYEDKEMLDSAEYYFRSYIQKDTVDADGPVRLGNVLKYQGKTDSVMYYFEKAYSMDSSNLMATYFLAQEYFGQANFEKTIELSETAKKVDSLDINFYLFHGLSALNMGHFEKAVEVANTAIAIDSANIDAILLAIEAEVMSKTQPGSVEQDSSFKYKFTDYRSSQLKAVLAREDFPSSNFDSLIQKDQTFGLDEYFERYINQRNNEGFSPYSARGNEQLNEYWQSENLIEVAKMAPDVLSGTPINLDDLYRVAVAHYMTGDLSAFTSYYTLYFGLVESIIATGDGRGYKTAFVVVSTSNEYALLHYFGLGSQGQSLQHHDGHSFDVLKTINEYEEQQDIYFMIDIPFGHLSSTLSKPSKKKDKKKKKRKDR
jgi:tetratricopeptide (TPR) repeat protein